MECEICGSRNAIRKTEIDGAVLAVCNNCVSMGKEVARVEVIQAKRPSTKMPSEIEYLLKPGFGSIIRSNRQKKNLTQ
jgi:ribosome-binding protein aMBF1 (putative translation factor)